MSQNRPYDEIGELSRADAAGIVAEALGQRAFRIQGLDIRIDEPAANWAPQGASRSQQLLVHQWDHLEPFLLHHSATGCSTSLRIVVDHVADWLAQFGDSIGRQSGPSESFVTYDTAVAGRLYRLSYLLQETRGARSSDQFLAALIRHGEWLAEDRNFTGHNNHGVMQSVCQVLAASRSVEAFERTDFLQQGLDRLQELVKKQYSVEGVHLEHSPGYHLLVTRLLTGLLPVGGVLSREINDLIPRAVRVASWMTMRSGELAELGDSERRSPYVRLVVPPDMIRTPTTPTLEVFPIAGYAFVKGIVDGRETYLAQSASFHSRTHKQADTCTFIWRDRGQDILVDSGLFDYEGRQATDTPLFRDGFRYSHPMRVLAESTRAHNTVELNGQNHPRYRARAFGSSLRGAVHEAGLFATETSVANLKGATHYRILVLAPGKWLICLDALRAQSSGKPMNVRQWFQLHPSLRLKQMVTGTNGAPAFTRHETEDGFRLEMVAMTTSAQIAEVAHGARSLHGSAGDREVLMGWWSPAKRVAEPCTALAFASDGATVQLVTLLSLGQLSGRPPSASSNVTGRAWRFVWEQDRERQELRVRRNPGGQLKLDYSPATISD